MCGITGGVPGIDARVLQRMTAALAHRGPDGEGYFHAAGQPGDRAGARAAASLGHRRLAVIDLARGQQPMTSADGRWTIVFNGEIYNFRELGRELESCGVALRTKSDTEVLLEAWARWGVEALERLRGMFAFALWDARERALWLVRDRLGVKPLYYAPAGDGLLFGSEIKALLAHPGVSRRLRPSAIDDYLTYLYVPAPQTIFEGVEELPPAHWLRFSNGAIELRRYWQALPRPAGEAKKAGAEELCALLDDAVRMRLVSDVPLGAFLSGGIDSSSIVALAARSQREPVRTFSLGFGAGEEHYTELEYARLVSGRYSTEHRELTVRPNCAELLPRMVSLFDEPFGNPTALLLHALSAATREHVTVALAGDAGDELFLGYPRYLGARLRRAWGAVPSPVRRAASALARAVPEGTNGFHARRRAREFLSAGDGSWQSAYVGWVTYFNPAQRRELYSPEFSAAVDGHFAESFLEDRFAEVAGADPLDQASYVDLHSFLPHNVLQYGDRMSMAHALELRQPFTDHRLVEFALGLPAEQKLRGRDTKHLLRVAMRPLLPEQTLRRSKLGLNPPLGRWLRGELAPLVDRYLSPEAIRRRGWFRPEAIARMRGDFE
ncbi:MAG TPA: asparagine synthase (glutamine-hydrolyzing), partial [Candidatus Acidoferrales bacterium]|nr:asparagine synthase (glutamine-hydrolyzing) [Candidatus Acidoferrales bacterium]